MAKTRKKSIERLNEMQEKKKDFIAKIIDDLSEKLKSETIEFEIQGRQKTPYSIWNKMKNKNMGFNNRSSIYAGLLRSSLEAFPTEKQVQPILLP